jgi:hypothetical protein
MLRSLRSRNHARSQQGAVAVETALLAPVLLIFLFGIVGLSMFIRDYVAVTTAARTGVRVAAAAPDAGACVSSSTDETPCPSGMVPNFAQIAADAVSRAGSALPKESIRFVMVFKPNAKGFPAAMNQMPSTCAGASNCVTYTWRPLQSAFRYAGGTWQSRTVNACFPNNVDPVAVRVVADHTFVNGLLFGATMAMEDTAVMNFEPLPVAQCGSGQHP